MVRSLLILLLLASTAQAETLALVNGQWVQAETAQVRFVEDVQLEPGQIAQIFEIVAETPEGFQRTFPATVREIAAPENVYRFGFDCPEGKYVIKYFLWSKDAPPKFKTLVKDFGPPPAPPVPDGPFDSIAKRVAQWSNGLPNRVEIGKIYQTASSKLATAEFATINDASKYIVDEVAKLKTPAWDTFEKNLSDDFGPRWPMPRQTLIEYWTEVSRGLK